nr:cral-trio domain-containing protein c23b6.04c [Quercus suber]
MSTQPASATAPNTLLSEKMAAATTTDASREESLASSIQSSSQPPPTDTPASTSNVSNVAVEHEQEWSAPIDGPLKTPVPRPAKNARPPPPPALTSEQQTKYATVLAAVSQWETLPSTSAKPTPQAPIQDHERMWLTRECILRYLRATKWIPANAIKRLQSTLTWRREFGSDTFTPEYISPENETGKQLVLGYDKEGRTCLYLNPGNQNTKVSDRQIHHLAYMLDRMVDMMPPGQESACLLISFKGSGSGNIPSVAQARSVLNILQNHSPERLGKALITDTPWYVSTFFKLISPFIDPVTKEKMKFNEDLKTYVPTEQLLKANGGDLDFVYDHSVYWPALIGECKKRSDAYRQRWESAGKRIGEYEAYLRGGSQPCLQQVLEAASKENGASTEEAKDADLVAAEVGKLSV